MSDFTHDTHAKSAVETRLGSTLANLSQVGQIAIETTGRSASIAILRGDEVLESHFLDDKVRTAASLAPALKEALASCQRLGLELSLVSVADGPGSFTGLRIGMTTAKTLAYAKKLPIVGVDSVAAVAVAAFLSATSADPICQIRVALDAYRGQAFIGEFRQDDLIPQLMAIPDTWTPHPASVRVADGADLADFFTNIEPGTYFAGDQKALDGRVTDKICVERGGRSGRVPTVVDAVGVGRMAIRSYALNRLQHPMDLLPRYLRRSAAEEKAAIKI